MESLQKKAGFNDDSGEINNCEHFIFFITHFRVTLNKTKLVTVKRKNCDGI